MISWGCHPANLENHESDAVHTKQNIGKSCGRFSFLTVTKKKKYQGLTLMVTEFQKVDQKFSVTAKWKVTITNRIIVWEIPLINMFKLGLAVIPSEEKLYHKN